MQKLIRNHEEGVGKVVVFLTIVLLLTIIGLALKVTNREAPSINAQREIRGIGVSTPVELQVQDLHYRINSVEVESSSGRPNVSSSGGEQRMGCSHAKVVEVLVAACREQRHIQGERGAQRDTRPEGRLCDADCHGNERFVGPILPRRP